MRFLLQSDTLQFLELLHQQWIYMILCLSYAIQLHVALCISQQEYKIKIILYILSLMGYQATMPKLLN
jgi:hypothetical protein